MIQSEVSGKCVITQFFPDNEIEDAARFAHAEFNRVNGDVDFEMIYLPVMISESDPLPLRGYVALKPVQEWQLPSFIIGHPAQKDPVVRVRWLDHASRKKL